MRFTTLDIQPLSNVRGGKAFQETIRVECGTRTRVLRASIHMDHYEHQSRAVVEVWTGDQWSQVFYIQPEQVGEGVEAVRERLFKTAIAILAV